MESDGATRETLPTEPTDPPTADADRPVETSPDESDLDPPLEAPIETPIDDLIEQRRTVTLEEPDEH